MRASSSSILAVVSLAPSLVSAAGTLGFALGTKKSDGSCKAQADYEADFDAISSNSPAKIVRGYAASDCNFAQNVLPAAATKGFQVVLGIWPDVDTSFNADKSAISDHALGQYRSQVYAVTVGSETLYRGNFTGDQLLSKIKDVKQMVGDIKVGTADSWNKFADGTADPVIKGNPDILLVNAFGFWQAQDISNASHQYFDDMMQAYQHIQSVAGGNKIELWNGETGWPTDHGSDYGAAKAGTQNAATYWSQGVCGMLGWGFNLFYFEAFDEPWKPASVGDNGKAADETHWGAFTFDRKPKFNMGC
jgi:glucan 1,3-beta-glucosidase